MAEKTKIQWTNHTFNPWRGCTRVSPGCQNCYAERQAGRNHAVLGKGWLTLDLWSLTHLNTPPGCDGAWGARMLAHPGSATGSEELTFVVRFGGELARGVTPDAAMQRLLRRCREDLNLEGGFHP